MTQEERPICLKCKTNKAKLNYRKNGKCNYKKFCSICHKKQYNIKNFSYKKYKKEKCEFCNFIPVNICQLDVDHIDGNHKNNDISNLQTLCANCHRLKTFLNVEGIYGIIK